MPASEGAQTQQCEEEAAKWSSRKSDLKLDPDTEEEPDSAVTAFTITCN